MANNIQFVIEKVRKLLSLAKSDNPHESAAATNAANRLIDEYRLSMAELEAASPEQAEAIEADPSPLLENGRVVVWKMRLAMVLSKHYGVFLYNDKRKAKNYYQLVGRKSDLEVVRYMFSWLTAEATRQIHARGKGKGHAFSNSYGQGFVAGIAEQLAASRQTVAAQATSSTALVAINAREQLARDWTMQHNHTRFSSKKSYSHSRTDGSAFEAGKQSGRSMHLGSAVGSGSSSRLLG